MLHEPASYSNGSGACAESPKRVPPRDDEPTLEREREPEHDDSELEEIDGALAADLQLSGPSRISASAAARLRTALLAGALLVCAPCCSRSVGGDRAGGGVDLGGTSGSGVDLAGTSGSGGVDLGTSDGGVGGAGSCGVPTSFQWSSSGVLVSPISDSSHDLLSIKDPTVVFYNNNWHVFASTFGNTTGYNMVYFNFSDWGQAASAPQYYLDKTPGLAGYHCAPQIFYFAPQKKWYLVYQSGPPTYSTTSDLSQPGTWTPPASFYASEPAIVTQNKGSGGWIDFWVICDDTTCFLFFSDDNGHFYRAKTPIGSFPNGFDTPVIVMSDPSPGRLFEASNVYSMKGTGKYLALIEAFDAGSGGRRYFRSWTATALDGTWTPLQAEYATPFASAANVTFSGTAWTKDISHGDMVRTSYDQKMEIDTCNLQYLYQGMNPSSTGAYNQLPWRLGLLTKRN